MHLPSFYGVKENLSKKPSGQDYGPRYAGRPFNGRNYLCPGARSRLTETSNNQVSSATVRVSD